MRCVLALAAAVAASSQDNMMSQGTSMSQDNGPNSLENPMPPGNSTGTFNPVKKDETMDEAMMSMTCGGFYDLEFDPWKFDRYGEYFTEDSTFTLHPAGKFTGPDAIKEYVKFASDESPFVDSFTVLPGSIALLGWKSQLVCSFTVMGHRRYELSARYAGGQAVHVATLATVTYNPTMHKIGDITLYYERPFMQFVFDSLRSRLESSKFVCDLLYTTCPQAGVDTKSHNELASYDECIQRFEGLPAFDDGPRLADSAEKGGGFDGDSSSCRLLHSFLASINPKGHCAHLSFVPMADSNGNVKCQTSKRMVATEQFDTTQFANFDQYKEAVGYPIADGFRVVDKCVYDSLRASIPRPYWASWRDAQAEQMDWWRAPPLEHIPQAEWAWVTTYAVWICVLILGLGSEWVVGTVITARLSMESLEIFWKAAAFTFPLFVTISLVSRSFWGLLFLVVGLWKCGSPETIVFFLMARNNNYSCAFRVQCAMNFLGTLLHHSATSLLIVSLTTHSEFLDRNVLSCTLPLVVQHWFVLVRYVDIRLYVIAELLIEFVWEWEVIFNIQNYYQCHGWNIVMIAATMLVAHWLYVGAATIKFCCPCLYTKAKKTAPASDEPDGTASEQQPPSQVSRWSKMREDVNEVHAALVAAEENTNPGITATLAAKRQQVRSKSATKGAFSAITSLPNNYLESIADVLAPMPANDEKLARHWRDNMQGTSSSDGE